jgi:hypothetical protein
MSDMKAKSDVTVGNQVEPAPSSIVGTLGCVSLLSIIKRSADSIALFKDFQVVVAKIASLSPDLTRDVLGSQLIGAHPSARFDLIDSVQQSLPAAQQVHHRTISLGDLIVYLCLLGIAELMSAYIYSALRFCV